MTAQRSFPVQDIASSTGDSLTIDHFAKQRTP